jgi:hypothetical protein
MKHWKGLTKGYKAIMVADDDLDMDTCVINRQGTITWIWIPALSTGKGRFCAGGGSRRRDARCTHGAHRAPVAVEAGADYVWHKGRRGRGGNSALAQHLDDVSAGL